MDFQAVPPPSQYGAPNVFQQAPQGQQGANQPSGQQGQNPIAALLAKAKALLSSGQISPDQYSQVASQAQELATSGGNMGSGMGAGQPMNISPGG